MPTLLQRCVHNTCLPAAFFPIPKILMQTGRRSDFIDYDPIISVDIGFADWFPFPSFSLTFSFVGLAAESDKAENRWGRGIERI